MEGHLPLPELLEVARNHNCFSILDDAHALGVLGAQGQGTHLISRWIQCS